ncbi:MAG: SMP-30/gluconolactonase/LRE family protein [Endozoicomonas sp.]|uniref:SMP-30/gluconolactonase/LRE family protein n=1 Tax=Endozoicomonas sp. TaxID=1892382 RepID=UPI003D9B309D
MKAVKNVLDAGSLLGECPRWHEPSSSLYWVDITGKTLNSWQPASGVRQSLTLSEEIGCFVFRKTNGLVAALRSGFVFIDSIESGRITPICDPESDKPHNRFNDGRCDALGRFWAGSVYSPKDKSDAWIYMLDNQLDCRRMAGPLLTSNGIAFSPDNQTLYYADTPQHTIYACDFDLEHAQLTNRRVFHRFPFGQGRPDGCAVDEAGCYWTALYEGAAVVRLSPGGVLLETIDLPVKYPTMVAFGGSDCSTLFITSCRQACSEEELESYPESGSIFAIEVEVKGLKENLFVL